MQPQIDKLFDASLFRRMPRGHGVTGPLFGLLMAVMPPGQPAFSQAAPPTVPQAATQPAAAQPAGSSPTAAQPGVPQAVPGFWDPRRRPDRPDLSRLTVIRFMTETDYPPFNFTGPDGNPAGFNVDLARLICDEIKVACTIQMRRFDTLLDAISSNRGDAIIASMAVTPELRKRLDFSDLYYRTPARFVSRRDKVMTEVRPELLEGKKVGVVAGSSHEAYLKTMFTDAELHPYPNEDALRQALQRGEVDFAFCDAVSYAFWINGTDSANCCAFSGGPFIESRYFGEGVGIAVKKGNDTLRQALNWALFRIWEKGHYTDLWLRYFSVNPF
jgi:polar amino acid transport system substrate-binding protein